MDWTWLSATLGGLLIGLAASFMLLSAGRIAGISGIVEGAILGKVAAAWQRWFVGGLVAGGAVALWLAPGAFASSSTVPGPVLVVAGLLVGFGTRLGSGCTSGHGVCGIPRLSPRSLVATGTFISSGMATVTFVRVCGCWS